ncbi:MAG TPA: hypothetical protein VLG12_07130 [Candidatus Saccharimonadales bacterium]|nr:hypothetical protein [Candidatus Saccharimonadales bacterium]
MNKKQLKRFIEGENYLQNPPMDSEDFIKYAAKMGIAITESELLDLEKKQVIEPLFKRGFGDEPIEWLRYKNDAGEFPKPAYYGLQDDETELERSLANPSIMYASFREHDKLALLHELETGILHSGEEKTLRYYSSFQIYLIHKDKPGLHSHSDRSFFSFLTFMLFVQAAYFPKFRSGGRTMQVTGMNLKKWQDKMRETNLKEELDYADITISDLLWRYKEFSGIATRLLGIVRDDWIQLWKDIDWEKKEKLEGQIRLGIEYLQWGVMLKEIIENIHGKKILDIDEIDNITYDDILKFDVKNMDQHGSLLRAIRNKNYTDGEKNYYDDRFKRLFYLANDFGIDYQPRIMLFVEGLTEQESIPFAMEFYSGLPENRGIEIISLDGIDGLYGKGQNMKDVRIKQFTSNFLNLVSYNLEKWQIIPYLIVDNESQIWEILTSEEYENKAIKFENASYGFPKKWTTIWGKDYTDIGYKGNSFELVNFSNVELSIVLSEVLNRNIAEEDIQKLREENKGISSIDKNISGQLKIEISRKLFKNLFGVLDKTENLELTRRPIFKAFDRLVDLAGTNYPPTTTRTEIRNREYIKKELAKD